MSEIRAISQRREDRATQLWYAVNVTPWSEVPDWVRDNFRSAADGYEAWLEDTESPEAAALPPSPPDRESEAL